MSIAPWQIASAMSSGPGDAGGSRRRWDRCWGDRGQGALADDHRVHELDGGVGRVRRGGAGAERDQRPPRENERHRVAGPGDAGRLSADELLHALALGDEAGEPFVRGGARPVVIRLSCS